MIKRHALNYIYFGTLFVLLALLHIFHVGLVDAGSGLTRLFYILYATIQCLIEVSALVLIGAWVTDKFPSFAKNVFAVGTFILFLIHLIDFPLMRLMDISIWYAFNIVFAESYENFVEMLKASSIQLSTWLFMGAIAAALAFIALIAFRAAERLSARRPFHFSYKAATLFTVSAVVILAFFDTRKSESGAAQDEERFLKTLPWKTTLFTGSHPQMTLQASIPTRPSEKWHQEKLNKLDVVLTHKPNIYLFIAESLREDFITPETAPTLSRFRTEEISFPHAVSAANATHESWFSIFHSVYPFSWEERQPKNWNLGSLPLQILKKAGYQIHVLSASHLNFYHMDQIMFGTSRSWADGLKVFPEENLEQSYVYDAKCIDTLIDKIKTSEEGHLFIVFLEGTHFDYSWPAHLSLPKRPIADAIDYIKITYSKDHLEGIKNRYRHAIYHVDHLFHRFLTALQSHPKKDEAVIVFTSDHGEEFFEEDRIFHASNLNKAQTRIPLYYRIPSKSAQTPLTSHLDIFPTLLDHVFGKNESLFDAWFDGESILRSRQKPFAISARYNGSRNPYEFLITTEDEQLLTRFDNRRDIRNSKALHIISRRDLHEKPLDISLDQIHNRYNPIIDSLVLNQTEHSK